jgi:hypothetical protein
MHVLRNGRLSQFNRRSEFHVTTPTLTNKMLAKAWNRFFKPWSNFASWGVYLYSTFRNWGAIFVNINTDFWSFIDLEFNFEVLAVILLHFNVTKMNQGSYLIFKNIFLFFLFNSNHSVSQYAYFTSQTAMRYCLFQAFLASVFGTVRCHCP